jgi:hypothetical protein
MMPKLPATVERNTASEFENNLRKLKEVLPNTPTAKLAALTTEENGNLEAVVGRIMLCEESNDDLRQGGETSITLA